MEQVEVTEMTQAEIVAAMVSGTAEHQANSMVRMVSQRVPVTTLSRIEAMATKAKKSRNAMVNLLLEAGLDSVSGLLDKSTRKSVNAAASKLAKAMVQDAEALTE